MNSMRLTSRIRGTQGYYAPEFLFDEHPSYNNKIDIWSMGCILYELAVGKRAFHTDWMTREYKVMGVLPEIPLDEYFSDDDTQRVQNAVTRMLNLEANTRPLARELVEEFWSNQEEAAQRRPDNVQIYQEFQSVYEPPKLDDNPTPALSSSFAALTTHWTRMVLQFKESRLEP
jgi:serine/threonine protein kinase